jgi:hypothetical protein
MMPYRFRPSAGFLLLGVVALTSIAFFAWGLATPPLDRLRRLQAELESGERGPLHAAERSLIERSLRDYPELAAAWLDGRSLGIVSRHESGLVDNGYAYLVRDSKRASTIEVTLTPGQKRGATVSARMGDRKAKGVLEAEQPWRWAIPGGAEATLVEILIEPVGGKKPPPVVLQLREAP